MASGIRVLASTAGPPSPLEARCPLPRTVVTTPGLHVDPADAVVGVVADVEVPLRVEGEVLRVVEAGLRGGSAVPVVAAEADSRAACRPAGPLLGGVVARVEAGEALDDAGSRVDAADVVGPLARQVEVAVGGDGDAAGGVHLGVHRRTAVAAAADLAAARDPGDDAAFGVDAAVDLVAEVGQVEVPLPVDGEVVGVVEAGRFRGAAVAAEAADAVAGEVVEDAVGVDAVEAVPLVVDDDEVAVRAAGDPEGPAGVGVARRDALAKAGAGDADDGSGVHLTEQFQKVHGRSGTIG